MRWIGGDGSGDPTRQPFVNGTRRVPPDTGTEDGGARSIARGRHLWLSVVRKAVEVAGRFRSET